MLYKRTFFDPFANYTRYQVHIRKNVVVDRMTFPKIVVLYFIIYIIWNSYRLVLMDLLVYLRKYFRVVHTIF